MKIYDKGIGNFFTDILNNDRLTAKNLWIE